MNIVWKKVKVGVVCLYQQHVELGKMKGLIGTETHRSTIIN